MPRRYRFRKNDFMHFASIKSLYGMFRPIEDKLRSAGYKGPIFADFDNSIYSNLNIEKNTPLNYVTIRDGDEAIYEGQGPLIIEQSAYMDSIFTKKADSDMQKYIKKLDDYLDLIIKNTPQKEYAEELAEAKFHKTLLRVFKTFGSQMLFNDQLGFLANIKAYDADVQTINDIGNFANPDENRDIWRMVNKYYPYSDLRDSMAEIANIACDYEECKEKNSFTTQIEFREKYKKALEDFKAADEALGLGKEDRDRLTRLYLRDEVIGEYKNADGNNKNVDYYAIIKRVEEQEANRHPVDPEDKRIVEGIRTEVDNRFITKYAEYDWCNSRYSKELKAAGYSTNERDFSGNRGNRNFLQEINAQINAIEMGWPIDELIHIQRIFNIFRSSTNLHSQVEGAGDFDAFKEKCKNFYEERIKNKPYPMNEEERQAFYQDFYALGQEASEVMRGIYENANDPDEPFETCSYTALKDGIKKSMEKPLSYIQKQIIKSVQIDESIELTDEAMLAIKNNLCVKKNRTHINSSEFDRLQKAFTKFSEKYERNNNEFIISPIHDLSSENLKLLKELRDAAKAYLDSRDKDERAPEERSIMGKERYEGASKAYLLASNTLRRREKILEDKAKEKREAERIKGRKEIKEAFFKTGTKEADASILFDKYKAGGEERYNELIEAERRAEAEALQKEPVTDEEKYERLINSYRVKKDDPVTAEDVDENEALQQTRISNFANMLAAIELQEEGKPFDLDKITKRGEQIRSVYSMDILKKVSDNQNGPEKLKNALTFKFKAVELKKELEESLYEVRKTKYKGIFESQNKFQHDLAEVLNRKRTAELSDRTLKVVNAINDILYLNLKDQSCVGINAHNLRKANAKLMKAITESFEGEKTFNKDGFGPKLVLDTLAVLTTYTGCRAVTNKLISKINATMRDQNGYMHNINIAKFTNNYGVDHSKNVSEKVRKKENQMNGPVNNL